MEENNLNDTPIAPENVPPAPPMPVPPKPKNNSILTALSVLLIILIGIVAFLGYQNFQLQKQITFLQATPSPTPLVSPQPSAEAETANWKTYEDTKTKFSFKYPADWILSTLPGQELTLELTKEDASQNRVTLPGDKVANAEYKIDIDTLTTNMYEYLKTITGLNPYVISVAEINGYAYQIPVTPSSGLSTTKVIQKDNKIYRFSYTAMANLDTHTKYLPTFDQILSTFQFINSSPSATPKACTMEAKICPDGSSMGRTGPNCEFAPCPTGH